MQINQNSRIGKTIKSLAARLAGAIFVVLVLLTFMILMRLLDAKRLPEKTIRTMETIDELALPPPPPIEIQSTASPPPPPRSVFGSNPGATYSARDRQGLYCR